MEHLFRFWPDFLACPGSLEEWGGKEPVRGVTATAQVQDGSPELAEAVMEAREQ